MTTERRLTRLEQELGPAAGRPLCIDDYNHVVRTFRDPLCQKAWWYDHWVTREEWQRLQREAKERTDRMYPEEEDDPPPPPPKEVSR